MHCAPHAGLVRIAVAILCLLASTNPAPAAPDQFHRPILVGYFPQWGVSTAKPYYVKSLISNHAAQLLAQINYSQGAVRQGRCSLADPFADLGFRFSRQDSVSGVADGRRARFRGNFHQLLELKQRFPRLKLIISLEGEARDFEQDAQPGNRQAFVASCVDTFLKGRFAPGIVHPGLFDGIDVDWETPAASDAANFEALLREFRKQMNTVRPGLLLTVAVDQSPQELSGTDFATIASLVDQVGIMNYDYAGPWSSLTGLLAPLFSPDAGDAYTIEHSIDSYKAAGVPPEKLLMGIPFYGYGWTEVGSEKNGLSQSGRAIKKDSPYNHIRDLVPGFSMYRDEPSQSPWLFDGNTFWTFEDPVSVRFKASYAFHQGLGGVMIWELSGDTPDSELLATAYQALHDPLAVETFAEHKRKQPVRRSVPALSKRID